MPQNSVPDNISTISDLTESINIDPGDTQSEFKAPVGANNIAPIRGRLTRVVTSKRNRTQAQLPFSVEYILNN
jgi:hypothetical protein